MKSALGMFRKLLLVVVPVTATSAIAVAPGYAASFSYSGSLTELSNFNSLASDLITSTDTDTDVVVPNAGDAQAIASAIAEFSQDNQPLWGESETSGAAIGTGSRYFATAKGEASLIGNFFLKQCQTFSFDFFTGFELFTFSNNPRQERASAFADTWFGLFDAKTGALLDSFSIFGSLTAGASPVFTSSANASNSFIYSLISDDPTTDFLEAGAVGSYSRKFDKETSNQLVAFQRNEAFAQTVPAPGALPGLFLTSVVLPYLKRKRNEKTEAAECCDAING